MEKIKASDKPYWLYLLECRDGSLYAGIALDVIKRFETHCCGKGAAYTRSHPPKRIVAFREYPCKGDALRAEYRLKKLPRFKKPGFFTAAIQPGPAEPAAREKLPS